jgi:hypothetical protein
LDAPRKTSMRSVEAASKAEPPPFRTQSAVPRSAPRLYGGDALDVVSSSSSYPQVTTVHDPWGYVLHSLFLPSF